MSGFRAYMLEARGAEAQGTPPRGGVHGGRADADVQGAVRDLSVDDLPAAEVLVRVAWSGINYKDALATRPASRVVRRYPMVPGIDLAGTVEASSDERFAPGDGVLATSYDLGTAHFGGFAEYARVPADWVIPLPRGLTLRQSMALGTAGFTAGLALARMEANGLQPGNGPVLVTGASGGVGSLAVWLLARRGYRVAASTGSADAHEYLRGLGADEILDRSETSAPDGKPLERGRWAGAVDTVGGPATPYLLRTAQPGATVALLGNRGGVPFATTVFPFILRGVSLLGVDSAYCPREPREQVWSALAGEDWSAVLDRIVADEVGLDGLTEALDRVLGGHVRGRILVRVGG